MGGLFGGGKKAPEPQKPEKVVQKPTDMAREQAAAMQARRGRAAGARSLLSGAQDEAQTSLAKKLGGGS
tara:strand:- start:486 stop:692 length:207 start_codon:yes stop_codon:yes gene_type:complete